MWIWCLIKWLGIIPPFQTCTTCSHRQSAPIGSNGSNRFRVNNMLKDYPPEKWFSLSPPLILITRSMESGALPFLPLMVSYLLEIPPSPLTLPFPLIIFGTISPLMTVHLIHQQQHRFL